MNPPLFTAESLAGASLEEIAAVLNACYETLWTDEIKLQERITAAIDAMLLSGGRRPGKVCAPGGVRKRREASCRCGGLMDGRSTCCLRCWMLIVGQAEVHPN